EQQAVADRVPGCSSHRQPVAPEVVNLALVDLESGAQILQPRAQIRAFAPPAADADVDVIALWEDPYVSPGHNAELDDCAAAEAFARNVGVGDVAFESNAVLGSREPERTRGDAVGPVGSDDDVRFQPLPRDSHRSGQVDGRHPGVVPELGAG